MSGLYHMHSGQLIKDVSVWWLFLVTQTVLHSVHSLQRNGRKEIWIEFGTGEKRRFLPLHIIADQMGEPLCRVLFKTHVHTGDDITSRIGTKLAAMQCNPPYYLTRVWRKTRTGTRWHFTSWRVHCTGLVRCPIKTKCQHIWWTSSACPLKCPYPHWHDEYATYIECYSWPYQTSILCGSQNCWAYC